MRIGKVWLKNSFFFLLVLFILFGESDLLPLLFLAAMVHELGHLVAIWIFGGKVQQISLSFFGGKIDYSREKESYLIKMSILLAGSMFNLLTALLFSAFGNSQQTLFFAGINILLAVFNLLPISLLDGGAALICLLAKYLDPHKAEGILEKIGGLFALLLLFLGAWVFLATSWNISLMLLAVFLLLYPLFGGKHLAQKRKNFHQKQRPK